jgi:hypothetical protein
LLDFEVLGPAPVPVLPHPAVPLCPKLPSTTEREEEEIRFGVGLIVRDTHVVKSIFLPPKRPRMEDDHAWTPYYWAPTPEENDTLIDLQRSHGQFVSQTKNMQN